MSFALSGICYALFLVTVEERVPGMMNGILYHLAPEITMILEQPPNTDFMQLMQEE